MKKNVKRILTLMMCVCMMASIVPVQASADTQPIKDGVYEMLSALDNGKAVCNYQMSGYGPIIFDRSYTPGGRYIFKYDSSDGCYTITAVDCKLSLTNQDGNKVKKGSKAIMYSSNNSTNQKWVVKKESDGNYSIRPKANQNICLDVAGGKTNNYNEVRLWSSNNTKSQRFQLVNCQNVQDGYCVIKSCLNKNYVLDIQNSSKYSCATVLLSKNKNTTSTSHSQVFNIKYDPNDGYYVITNTNSGKVVDVRGGTSAKSGNDVHQYAYHGKANQKWYFYPMGNGVYIISSKVDPNLSLEVAGGKAADGSNVQISWVRGQMSTRFYLDFNYQGFKINPRDEDCGYGTYNEKFL